MKGKSGPFCKLWRFSRAHRTSSGVSIQMFQGPGSAHKCPDLNVTYLPCLRFQVLLEPVSQLCLLLHYRISGCFMKFAHLAITYFFSVSLCRDQHNLWVTSHLHFLWRHSFSMFPVPFLVLWWFLTVLGLFSTYKHAPCTEMFSRLSPREIVSNWAIPFDYSLFLNQLLLRTEERASPKPHLTACFLNPHSQHPLC